MRASVSICIHVTAAYRRKETNDEFAERMERTVQACLDNHAKRLNAVAGADFGTVEPINAEE